jgi:hypothetical protein
MPPVRRRLLNLLTLVSLLPCVAVLWLWASSYGYPFHYGWTDSSGTTWFMGSAPGSLLLSRQAGWATPLPHVFRFDTTGFGAVAVRSPNGQVGVTHLDQMQHESVAGPGGAQVIVPVRPHGVPGVWLTQHRTVIPLAALPGSPVITTNINTVQLAYPLLLLLAVSAPVGLTWREARRRARARQGGKCPVCDYDLRASPGRCPECGNAPEGAAL